MVGGNGGNQFREYAGQNNGLIVVLGIANLNANQIRNGNVVATRVEDTGNGNNGTQTDNAPVCNSDGSAESIQMMHMLLPKPDSFYHTKQKMPLGYQNPFYLKQAQKRQQSLYNGKVLLEKHDPPVVYDSEETLQLAQENKFVREFKSLVKEADEYLAKYKAIEFEIFHLLRVVVSQDVMSIVQSNSIVGVHITAKTRRPQPRSNTKNEKVPSTFKSSSIQNKEVEVEEHHRNLLLSKNKKHMSFECNNIKLAIRNDKSNSSASSVIDVRIDNGKELNNQVLKEYFDSVGISQQASSVRTSQQNGVMKQRNRTLVETARTIMFPEEYDEVEKYVGGLLDMIQGSAMVSKPKTMQDAIEVATDLMDQNICKFAERQAENKRKLDDNSRNNHTQQQPHKRSPATTNNNQRAPEENHRVVTCVEYGVQGHYKKDSPKLKNNNCGNPARNNGAPARVYAVGNVGKNLDYNVVTGTFILKNRYASILFDTGADRSFVSTAFSSLTDIVPTKLDHDYNVKLADRKIIIVNTIIRGYTLNFLNHPFNIGLISVELGIFDVIIGMDWLTKYDAVIIYDEKISRVPFGNEILIVCGNGSNNGHESRLNIISCIKTQKLRLELLMAVLVLSYSKHQQRHLLSLGD
nr:hypothetical protein [Tanacetum cinerariifolium]